MAEAGETQFLVTGDKPLLGLRACLETIVPFGETAR